MTDCINYGEPKIDTNIGITVCRPIHSCINVGDFVALNRLFKLLPNEKRAQQISFTDIAREILFQKISF